RRRRQRGAARDLVARRHRARHPGAGGGVAAVVFARARAACDRCARRRGALGRARLSRRQPSLDESSRRSNRALGKSPTSVGRRAALCGLAVAVLHNAVDFSWESAAVAGATVALVALAFPALRLRGKWPWRSLVVVPGAVLLALCLTPLGTRADRELRHDSD